MKSAANWAERGTCTRAQVGAVISREGRILSSGYNGAPAGLPHCSHPCDCLASEGLKHLSDCGIYDPCTIAIHAEINAIIHAAKYGVGIKDAELHTTRMPCLNCAGMIVNAGISRVVWQEPHREQSGLYLLIEAGLEVVQYVHD